MIIVFFMIAFKTKYCCVNFFQPIVRGITSRAQSVMETGHQINGAAINGLICAVR